MHESPRVESASPVKPLTAEQQKHVREAKGLPERLAASLAAQHGRRHLEELRGVGGLALVEAARTYDPSSGTPFELYALPGVRGAMLDALARERRRGRVDAQLQAASASEPLAPCRAVTPEESLERRRAYARAFAALAEAEGQLSSDERDVLRMHYGEGRELKGVARLLGVSYATVRRARDRALAWLRARLEQLGITEAIPPSWEPSSERRA